MLRPNVPIAPFLPLLLLSACTNDLLWHPADTASFSDPEADSSFHGTVSVIPAYEDDGGALVELDWEQANDGAFPFGALWVDAFGLDPSTGARLDGDEVAILEPETGSNTWTLDFSELGAEPFYVEAVLDELDDGIIGIAEPSALWHQLLTVSGGQVLDPEGAVVDGIDIYITVPWDAPVEGGDATDADGDGVLSAAEIAEALAEALESATEALGNNANEPDSFVTLTGDAAIDGVAAGDCATMLFSENGYGPYYWTYFGAVGLEPGDREWSVEVLANDGRMLLSGACDTNGNGLFDPADVWGTWVWDGEAQNPIDIGDVDINDIHIEVPFDGAFTTAAPIITLSGTVSDPGGFESYKPEAVLYVVAQRSVGVADIATLDHEYAWTAYAGADLSAGPVEFTLSVPAYKNLYIWAWVDVDGDGVLNEEGEPGGASGPWYTDTDRDSIAIAMTPAAAW